MNETLYRKKYSPPNFKMEQIHLTFYLNPSETRVVAKWPFVRLKDGPLELFFEDLKICSLRMNSRDLLPDLKSLGNSRSGRIEIANLPDQGHFEIETRICPGKNTELSGLYYQDGFFCTQCEPTGFRRITAFPDRPDVLSQYTVEIIHPDSDWTLLSNGNLIESSPGRALYRDPFPKPCYLFALVAGKLAKISKNKNGCELEVYAPKEQIEHCHFALQCLEQAVEWDQKVFGLPMDLKQYKIVVSRKFSGGAMENKGLNIFNSELVLAAPHLTEDAQYERIDSVVAHEYFHNWTGNRVTLRDWFELSLKEGLTVFRDQEYTRDVSGDATSARLSDMLRLTSLQFKEDAGPSAHPVRPLEALSVDNLFTSTIYEKGAEVIRMLKTLIGDESFFQGFSDYIKTYDGQAVSIDEWLQCFSKSIGKDLSHFAQWYERVGTPRLELTVRSDFSGAKSGWFVRAKQEGEPLVIPIRTRILSSEPTPETVLVLDKSVEEFFLPSSDPDSTISLLRDFSAPVYCDVKLEAKSSRRLLQEDTDGTVLYRELETLKRRLIVDQSALAESNCLEAHTVLLSRKDLSPRLRSMLFQWPSVASVIEAFHSSPDFQGVDFEQARVARDKRYALPLSGSVKIEDIERAFVELDKEPPGFSYKKAGLRSWAYTLAKILSISENENAQRLLLDRLKSLDLPLSDQMASLSILLSSAKESQSGMYKEVQEQRLLFTERALRDPSQALLTKSIRLCAMARGFDDTLRGVKKLMNSPSEFDWTIPSHHYSLWGVFEHGRPEILFHPSGQFLELLTDSLLKVDALNPQVAARLLNLFEVAGSLKKDVKSSAYQCIRRLHSEPSLSKNAREIVLKHMSFC